MWLLRSDVHARFERWLQLDVKPSAEQLGKFMERREKTAGRDPACLTIAGDVAEICVEGVLTPQPDFWAWLFYGSNTSYSEIRESIAIAQSNPAVKRIEFAVDSPGGQVAGLFETLGAIEAINPSKKRSVKATLAASAAYSIAAVAGAITATSIAAEFGSIGVAQTFIRYADVQIIDITSTEAPDKRPDPTTPEGQAVIRRELDAIHEIFVDAIARGRTNAGADTTAAQVNADFGRGAVFLAREAMTRGMIDKAPKPLRAVKKTEEDPGAPIAANPIDGPAESDAPETEQMTTTVMTAESFKAQNPELYRTIVEDAKATGKAEGEAAERKRVTSHLKLGKSSGSSELAEKFIASGVSSMDEEVFAEYQSAAMNRRDQSARQTDSDAAGKAADSAKPSTTSGGSGPAAPAAEEGDLGDQVVARLEAQRGKKPPKA